MRTLIAPRVAAAALLCSTTLAFGGAIDVPQMGARGAGQADAFSAQADDATAIFYNPAGLTQLHGTNLTGGVTAFFPDWQFTSTSGQTQKMGLVSVLPDLYAATDFGLDRWRFGIGFNNPFGLNEDWGHHGPLTELVTQAHLFTYNLAPSIAYRITDQLSVGVDLNVYFGDLELNRSVVLGPPPTPTGHFHYRGQDAVLGVTPGILWKIDSRNTIGLVYRSPFDMNFGGDARLKANGIPEMGPSRTHVNLEYPQQVTLAYAMRPIKPLKLETDIVWTDWNTVEQLTVSSVNPAFNQVQKADWRSGFTFRFGGQYDLDQHWAFRAGYAYGQGAVPASTFSPLVPDSNYHLFSVGVGYSRANWSIDAAYQFIYREDRHISGSTNSPLVDGTWKNNFNTLVASLTLRL